MIKILKKSDIFKNFKKYKKTKYNKEKEKTFKKYLWKVTLRI